MAAVWRHDAQGRDAGLRVVNDGSRNGQRDRTWRQTWRRRSEPDQGEHRATAEWTAWSWRQSTPVWQLPSSPACCYSLPSGT